MKNNHCAQRGCRIIDFEDAFGHLLNDWWRCSVGLDSHKEDEIACDDHHVITNRLIAPVVAIFSMLCTKQ